MRWTIEKRVVIALASALTLLAINAAISFRASRTMICNELILALAAVAVGPATKLGIIKTS